MSQDGGSQSGAAVAPAREQVGAGSDSTQKWVRRVLVVAGLLVYFWSFFPTAVNGLGGDRFRGGFCAYFTLVWPWTDGLHDSQTDPVSFLSMLFSGWVNPTFLLICIMPPFAVLRALAKWLLKPLWVVCALSCWVVFLKDHMTPTWGYYLWTLGMVMILFRERLLATVFRTGRAKTV
jgi:hypothetical protein